MSYETVWTFETANYRVTLDVAPEEDAPDFENEADIEAIMTGRVAWFMARVRVFKAGVLIGSDYLGGCAYKTVEEFYTAHRTSPAASRNTLASRAANVCYCHYFPDMVSEAIGSARATLAKLCA